MRNQSSDIDAALLLEQTGWLQALAWNLVKDSHRAEELTQDTLVAALHNPPRSSREGPALRAWLAKVARNLAFSSARKGRNRAAREQELARPERLPSTAEAVERAELRQRLVDAILELDSPYREVVILRHLEGLDNASIAERTGASAQTVRTQLSRGLSRLRARLDKEYGDDRKSWLAVALPLANEKEVLALGSASASIALPLLLSAAVLISITLGVKAWLGANRVTPLDGELPVALVEHEEGTTAITQDSGSGNASDAENATDRSSVSFEAPEAQGQAASRLAVANDARRIELRTDVHPNEPGYADAKRFPRYPERTGEVPLGPPHSFQMETATRGMDAFGYRAISIRLVEEERDSFHAWTTEIVGRTLAVIVDGQIMTLATVKKPLPPEFIIEGQFDDAQVTEILAKLGFPESHFEPYTFHGAVVDSDGLPLTDAPLEIRVYPGNATLLPNGAFSVEVENRELKKVRVSTQGYAEVTVFLAREHDSPSEAMTIDLIREASLDLRVVDESGEAVEGAQVRVNSLAGKNSLRPRWTTAGWGHQFGRFNEREMTTSSNGTVQIADLPPEVVLSIEVSRPNATVEGETESGTATATTPSLMVSTAVERLPAVSHTVVLDPGESRTLELRFPPRHTLSGRVIDHRSEGVPGVKVYHHPLMIQARHASPIPLAPEWMSAFAVTDSQGRFEFSFLPEGSYAVGVDGTRGVLGAKGDRLNGLAVPLDLNEVTAGQGVSIRLHPVQSLSGTLLSASGKPIGKDQVWLRHESGAGPFPATTNDDGTFRFDSLAPGEYELNSGDIAPLESEVLLAKAGDSDLILREAVCMVRLHVIGESHLDDMEFFGQLASTGTDGLRSRSLESRGSNELRCTQVPPGKYDAVVRTRDGHVGLLSGLVVKKGQEQVSHDLTLKPGVPLELRFGHEAPDGWYRVLLGKTVVAGGPVYPGLIDWQVVPEGVLRVELRPRGGEVQATRTLEASPGRRALVSFEP